RASAHLQHMRVNHGGADIGMTQEFLHGADVIARLQQVRGKGMAQGMRRGLLTEPGQLNRLAKRPLKSHILHMVAPLDTRARTHAEPIRRKHPLPTPGLSVARVLGSQRMGHPHPRLIVCAIRFEHPAHPFKMLPQGLRQTLGQHDSAVFPALAITHDDGLVLEIHILDPQAQPLHQPHAGAIQQAAQQLVAWIERTQHRLHL
ncbi:MAG: hypothetical protein RI920_1069, partial [Pseudomonadota bacterium]